MDIMIGILKAWRRVIYLELLHIILNFRWEFNHLLFNRWSIGFCRWFILPILGWIIIGIDRIVLYGYSLIKHYIIFFFTLRYLFFLALSYSRLEQVVDSWGRSLLSNFRLCWQMHWTFIEKFVWILGVFSSCIFILTLLNQCENLSLCMIKLMF